MKSYLLAMVMSLIFGMTSEFNQQKCLITGFEVQKGMTQRSYVRYLDVNFAAAEDVVPFSRVKLTRFNLNGSGGVNVNLTGVITVTDTVMSFDFGVQGIGGNRNSSIGDGYYVLSFDLDDDGIFETTLAFYRMLGDVNGDKVINVADGNFIIASYGQTGPMVEADVNGDGVVTPFDLMLTIRPTYTFLNPALHLDD